MRSIKRYLLLTAATGAILVGSVVPVAVAQPPAERGTVSGVVLDANTESPVPNATVRLTPLAAEEGGPLAQEEVQVATAAEGRFTLEAEEGLYRLHVEATDYVPKPDETVEVRARKPLELRLLLQSVVVALRKEVEALRAAWQEQHLGEAEPSPEQQEVLVVLGELEQAVQAGDAERALRLFSEDRFQRVDLGGDVERALRLFMEDRSRQRNRGREAGTPDPQDLTLVISADGYAAWRDTLRQAVADGLQLKFVNPTVFLRGERAGVEAIVVVVQGRAVLAQVKQVAFVRENGVWRIAGVHFPLPDPLAAIQEAEAERQEKEGGSFSNDEKHLLQQEKISYQFPHAGRAVQALNGAIWIARDPEQRMALYRDLLRRFPRPLGLYFFQSKREPVGSYGRYTHYGVQQTLAETFYRLGRIEEATTEYEKCLAYLPPAAWELMAQSVQERLDFIHRHNGPEREPLRLFAQGRYQELLDQYPHSDLADNALLELAKKERDDPEKARQLYQRILDEYPDSEVTDTAIFFLAGTYFRDENRQVLKENLDLVGRLYRQVVERFPHSPWADGAQKRLQALEGRSTQAQEKPILKSKEPPLLTPGRHFAAGPVARLWAYEHQGICTNSFPWTMTIGGTLPASVTRWSVRAPGRVLTDRRSAHDPVWSPEGKEILFVAAPRPHPNGNPSSDLWVINADDGNERRLTTTGDILGRPQWWPGKQVLFTRQSPEGTTIWLKDFEAEKQMTFEGQALHPTYSPDGQRIADVFSPHPAADFSLWVMDVGAFPPIIERYQVDDTNKRKLVDGVQPQPVAWSRDGQRIAFTDAEGRLMTLEVATGAVRILTDPPPFARDVTPAWSPDNCLIAFVRETRAARTLWMVPADRPGEQPLTVGTRFDEDPWFSNERESNLKRSSNFYRLLYVTSPNGKEGDEGDWWLRTMTFVRGQ